jgi:hypothetical protein
MIVYNVILLIVKTMSFRIGKYTVVCQTDANTSHSGPLPFNRDDIAYIVEEVWRGKSGLGTHSERICLTRWDKRKPLSFQNCICLTRAEADRHDKYDPEKLHEYYTSEQLAYIQQRFEEERVYSQWR